MKPALTLLTSLLLALLAALHAADKSAPAYRIQLDTVSEGWDGKVCWAQARAGAIPREGAAPIVVITASPLLVTGSDVYFDIHDWRSDDLGRTWVGPVKHAATLGRKAAGESGGRPVTSVPGDFWPQFHRKSGKLLGLGVTFTYVDDKAPIANRDAETIYTTYDPAKREWAAPKKLHFTDPDLARDARAACVQRFDLPEGDILLPIYFKPEGSKFSRVRVVRCGYDGDTLTMKEVGPEIRLDTKRGLAEPSITRVGGKFFLTIRHDEGAYVTRSDDGLRFEPMRPWTWDDGTPLGSYNTQAHWVARGGALFLVYTRRGANNDHIFRHRAPLFIAEVDTEKLAVKRVTERVLIPERGARYGNFGVCDVGADETWIVETEWMQRPPEEPVIPVENRWGAKARVYAARILWQKP